MVRMAQIELEDGNVVDAVTPGDLTLHPGEWCVLDGGRNQEFGRVLRTIEEAPDPPAGQQPPLVMRLANTADHRRAKEHATEGCKAMAVIARLMQTSGLPIRLLRHRFSFDRAVLHVTYTAEEKVDARELARTIGQELQIYVAMRQIGARDAARMEGGLSVCGRTLCCKSWRKGFESVSVKMAKAQGLPVNPTAINGMCGRLKCCLCYEYDAYRHCAAGLQRDGGSVCCHEGDGVVNERTGPADGHEQEK
ncbi:MAG: regulatory iron-sulfur-containing complex subunit RicT [bacterium]